MTAVRDETSRVIAMTDFNGSTRRYAYDARGALIDYTNTRGQRFKYEYDGQGRLRSVIKADGTRVNIQRDEKGRVRRLLSSNSTKFGRNSDYSLAHSFAQQDIDIGEVGVVNVTDTINAWQYMPVNGGMVGSDGSMFLPMESAGYGEGGGGGGACETREQCINKRAQSAERTRISCRWDAVGLFLITAGISISAAALSALVTGPTVVGTIVSLIGGGAAVAIAVVGLVNDFSRCDSTAAAYVRDSQDICGSKPITCP